MDLNELLIRTRPRLSIALGSQLCLVMLWRPWVYSCRSPCRSFLVTFPISCEFGPRSVGRKPSKLKTFRPHSNARGQTVMAGMSFHLLGYVFNRIFTEINLRGVRYFGVVWTQTFGTFSHPLNIAWMSLTCRDSEERALAMAMWVRQ